MSTTTTPTALSTIIAWLTPVEPQWREMVVERFEQSARDNLAAFLRWLAAGPKPSTSGIVDSWNRPWPRDRGPTTRYVLCSLEEPSHVYPPKKFTHGTAPELYSADLVKAREDGNREFQSIYDTFVAHTVDKLTKMLGERAFTISGKLGLHGLIETVAVVRAEGIELTVQLSVKTNYRYGHNAANGHMTVYSQYPFIVNACIVEGKGALPDTSVDEIAKVLNGTEYERKVRSTHDEKVARQARLFDLKRLEAIREAYSAAADDLSYIEKHEASGVVNENGYKPTIDERTLRLIERAGLTMPATAKEARTLRGEALAKIKALRAETKVEREARS